MRGKRRKSTARSWTKLPPKRVQIVMTIGSALTIIEEWKKILDGELKPEKSIHVNGLVNRIKKRFE